jgi:hypothetical protein
MNRRALPLILLPLLLLAPDSLGGRARVPGFVVVRDFDRGVLGRGVNSNPDGFDFWSSAVYDEKGYNGTQGARDDLKGYWPQPPCTGGDAWGGGIQLPEPVKYGEEIWVRLRVKFPDGWSWHTNGVGMKFIRLTRVDERGRNAGRYDLYLDNGAAGGRQPYLINEFANDVRFYFGNGTSDDPQLGVWETWEMYAALDVVPVNQGGNARVRVWKNGKLLVDRTDEPTLNDREETIPNVLISTYWNNPCEAPAKSQSVRYDDIQVQSATPDRLDAEGNWMIGP